MNTVKTKAEVKRIIFGILSFSAVQRHCIHRAAAPPFNQEQRALPATRRIQC